MSYRGLRALGRCVLIAALFPASCGRTQTVPQPKPESTTGSRKTKGVAEGRDLRVIDDLANMLIHPSPFVQAAGEERVRADAKELFERLLAALATDDYATRVRACRLLRIMMSPWARGVEAGRKHRGQCELFLPRRPVRRSHKHPRAAEGRAAASEALRSLLGHSRDVRRSRKNPDFPGVRYLEAVDGVCELLAEVGDDTTATDIASALAREENRYVASALISCLEYLHGLPPSYRWTGFCGNCTPEEIARISREENARCARAKADLLAWHEQHAGDRELARVRAALAVWETKFGDGDFLNQEYYNTGWATRRLEPLIRFDVCILDEVRRRKRAATNITVKGNYDIIIAAVTGGGDKALVQKLLRGSDPQRGLACQIIAAAGSHDWKEELDRLQYRGGFRSGLASHTLAVCHRAEAIPLLRKAHALNKHNFYAECAAKELEAWRKETASGPAPTEEQVLAVARAWLDRRVLGTPGGSARWELVATKAENHWTVTIPSKVTRTVPGGLPERLRVDLETGRVRAETSVE